MMRRFSRKRRGESGRRGAESIDAARWLGRVEEAGVLPVSKLEVIEEEGVSDRLAALGRGETSAGDPAIVAFSPIRAEDALLAALAVGMRLSAEESFKGTVYAVAPVWSLVARRRLGLVRAELPFELRTVSAEGLRTGGENIEAEADLEPGGLRIESVAMGLKDPAERALFDRATRGLDGLAAKHGGSIRAVGQSIELVVLAQRVAELRAEDGGSALNVLEGQRRRTPLEPGALAAGLDDLEGQIRRRLNDKKVRGSEEALRTKVAEAMVGEAELRNSWAWPLGGADRETVDLAALRSDGHPVAVVGRNTFDLAALGKFLDGVQKLRLAMPALFADALAPVRLETPHLILAAKEFSPAALRAVSALAAAHELYEIRTGRDQSVTLNSIGAEEAAKSRRDASSRRRRSGGRPPRGEGRGRAAESDAGKPEERGEEASGGSDSGRRRGRRRGRGRDAAEAGDEKRSAPSASEERPAFDEVSLFDLDETEGKDESSGGRRRGRSRQRSRRRGEGRREGRATTDRDGAESSRPDPSRAKSADADNAQDESAESEEFGEDLTEVLSEIPEDLPALQATKEAGYQAEDLEESGDGEDRDRQRDRDARRAARKSEVAELPVAVEPPRPPRRRAVIVAAADRDAVTTAVLLARDVRLLEGVWVYKQAELMNFFREVMPDIEEDVPIHMVGFIPSPAAEVLQAAALYRDRLTWYDHHEWPPEDVFALRQSIGEEAVHHVPGAGSTLPLVLATSTRRSRFSDKLVDLACGRFTEHDYERWGRVWWWRLGEIAKKSGDVRSDIEPLLAGRPSDLAKEAALVDPPEIPGEVAFVAARDFKVVHFAGYSMVVVEASEGFDVQLAARVARERYGAQLSLGYQEGSDLFVFSGEESGGRRTLDFAALAEHLAEKLDWVEPLPDDDHVARFRVSGLDRHPDRLDEVTGEIAMGRSILER